MALQDCTDTAHSQVLLAVLKVGVRTGSSPGCRGGSGIVQCAEGKSVLVQHSCGLQGEGQEYLQLRGSQGKKKPVKLCVIVCERTNMYFITNSMR